MTSRLPGSVERMLPPSPLARRLSVQSVLFAFGEGTFLTGSAVFFTQIVGLSAAQVGLGITIAGVTSFFFAVPLGKVTDRIGAKEAWALSAAGEALLYLVWPWIGGFAAFVGTLVLLEIVGGLGHAGRQAYTLDVFSREERVRSMAFMRSALNIGFTLGALSGGLALALDSDTVIRAVPVLTAVILGINAFLIVRLPTPQHAEAEAAAPAEEAMRSGALRNRGFLAMCFCDGVLGTNQVLLNVVIPLWLVEATDAPHVLLAWLFGTNTVLAVLLQVSAARGADTVPGALRASRISSLFFVASCLIVLVTHDTIGWATIVLVWVGHVTVTGAELFQSAGAWGLQAELSDPRKRGEYAGASSLGYTAGSVWAPALYTYLAMEWGTEGWLLIAGIVVLATVGIHPSAHAAERYLSRDSTAATA